MEAEVDVEVKEGGPGKVLGRMELGFLMAAQDPVGNEGLMVPKAVVQNV
jgi:hypothetical protein